MNLHKKQKKCWVKNKKILLLFALLFAGCTAGRDYSIRDEILPVDPASETFVNFVWEEAKTFRPVCDGDCPIGAAEAIARWNDISPGLITEDGLVAIIFRPASPNEIRAALEAAGYDPSDTSYLQGAALVEDDGCHVLTSYSRQDAPALFAHEIGHCLGFAHSPNPDSIMNVGIGNFFTSRIVEVMEESF